jgi:chemotaxis regulatin CheY-phosphate phosphatase CheZ
MKQGGQTNGTDRIDELRNVMKLGKQFFGFFDDLLRFYYEITPLLGRMNQSIEESSSKLPRASTSLSRVTKETERATIEILDILEIVSQTIEEGKKKIQEYKIREQKRSSAIGECIGFAETISQTLTDGDRETLRNRISEITVHDGDDDLLSSVTGYFDKIADYTSNISISLQVQDITSQQLAAVNHLVESVHLRLKHLLDNYNEPGVSPLSENVGSGPTTFDADAEYIRSHDKQNLADTLSEEHRRFANAPNRAGMQKDSTAGQRITTQAEIDQLFGSR